MADTGDLIEMLGKLRVPPQPTALAFEMDNPYATLASSGAALAQRGANRLDAAMVDDLRSKIAGMVPAQRAHESQMELLKRFTPGPMQNADIGVGAGLMGGEIDAAAALNKMRAETLADYAGSAKDLTGTRYNIVPVAETIREAGLNPGAPGELPSVTAAAAGKPEQYTITTEQFIPGQDGNPPIKLGTRQVGPNPKTNPAQPAIDQANAAARGQATANTDNTVRNMTGKYRSGSGKSYEIKDTGGPTVTVIREDGVAKEVPREVLEGRAK